MKYTKQALLVITIMFIGLKSQAQEITLFPGFWGEQYYQDDQRIDKKEVQKLMSEHELPKMYWDKSKRNRNIAFLAVVIQFGALLWQLDSASNGSNQYPPLLLNIGAGVVGIKYALSSNSLKKKAILSYNKIQDEGEVISLHIGQTMNGLGLALSF